MSFRIAGAGLMAVLLFGPVPASAADLSGDPYDDPRYAEIYRDSPPPSRRYVERERVEERFDHGDRYSKYEGEKEYVDKGYGDKYDGGFKDGYGKYDGGLKDGYGKYGDGGYDGDGDRYADGKCIPRHLIRRELRDEGWRDFDDLNIHGEYVLLKARRPSGRLFDLKIDRCSGDIVRARPCDGEYYNQYAYGPRRFWRY